MKGNYIFSLLSFVSGEACFGAGKCLVDADCPSREVKTGTLFTS